MSPIPPLGTGADLLEWHRWCRLLPRVRRFAAARDPGGRFAFYAASRNPRGPGRPELELREGVHGVRERRLLTVYKEALERAYDCFVKQGRPEPVAKRNGRIPVYVFAVDDPALDCGSPCADEIIFLGPSGTSPRVVSVLALPSRCSEPERRTAEAQARAAAVHELSHLFNARYLPYRRLDSFGKELTQPREWIRSWLWLDEGWAVASEADAAEAKVIPPNKDWLGFALDWVDRPERSLDDPDGRYQAALFVRYLSRLMGERGQPGLLNRVWQLSRTVWAPIGQGPNRVRYAAVTALAEILGRLPRPNTFCSPDEEDVFASGFCFDSYFLADRMSRGYEPAVFKRFGDRAVTRTWPALPNTTPPSGSPEVYPLPGLACRYFRFIPASRPGKLTVRVLAEAGHQLKAELALAAPKTKRFVPKSRQVGRRQTEGDKDVLISELPGFSRHACDHAVLVVTNCAFASQQPGQLPPFGYTQRVDFTVEFGFA